MRKLLQYLLKRPLTWMGNKLAAAPKKEAVERSLTDLLTSSSKLLSNRLKVIDTDLFNAKFIVFSDQHKGNRSWADDFQASEKNYIAALDHYNIEKFTFINLGDSEELWKFNLQQILPQNKDAFTAEAAFQPDRYYKTFGNHDIIWKNKLDVIILLNNIFQMPLPVYEGMLLQNNTGELFNIFLTHGHQGDSMSDNNRLSTWIVAHIWMPLQRYLRLNINSPSKDFSLRNKHNKMMYDWSSKQKKLLLITGHTHNPVFASGRYLDHPSNKIAADKPAAYLKPSYFNSGCCCYTDGDVTGIEIEGGMIRLVKWYDEGVVSKRMILEEIGLKELIKDLE
ncbi:MAG: metallophosphoesterase [Ferruginibacter sp.]